MHVHHVLKLHVETVHAPFGFDVVVVVIGNTAAVDGRWKRPETEDIYPVAGVEKC